MSTTLGKRRMLTEGTAAGRMPLDARRLDLARQALGTEGTLTGVCPEMGFEREEDALRAVAESLGLAFVDPAALKFDRALLKSFPVKLIHRYSVFPVRREKDTLHLAVSNPFDLHAADAVAAATGWSVVPVVVPADELAALIKRQLGVGAETIDGLMAQQDEQPGIEVVSDVDWDSVEGGAAAQEASVVRLVNEILIEAVEGRASDVHLESQASGIRIRYRIDGVLQPQRMPPEINRFHAAIVSRLKIMARLNIAEKRVPQDGRIKLKVANREVDVRVSIIPMLYGEGIVLRILDKDRMHFSLVGIGMDADIYKRFRRLIELPHGILLVTGPTGSGKTTTLYSALDEIKSEETKIITTEDPIEYHLDGINQIQVASESRVDVLFEFAEHPAARPGRDPGGRNPRPGDGRERHPSRPDRAPGVQHPAHQRRGQRVFADGRHGRRAVPGVQHGRRGDGPAAGPHALRGVPRALHAQAG